MVLLLLLLLADWAEDAVDDVLLENLNCCVVPALAILSRAARVIRFVVGMPYSSSSSPSLKSLLLCAL